MADVKRKSHVGSKQITLNIGGRTKLTTSQDLLCSVKGSVLERMFSGAH